MEKDKISFTSFIKNEILEHNWTKRQKEILFLSLLKTNGFFKEEKYIFTTGLLEREDYLTDLFKTIYSLDVVPKKTKTLLKYEISNEEFTEKFSNKLKENVLKNIEESKAYISGVFLGKGWISSPKSRFYHCELRIKNLDHSLDVQEILNILGIKSSTIRKNDWYTTYIKKAADISTIIRSFNASQSLMLFEDSRIERDFVATYKKMESIEAYNLNKIRNSSKKQIDIINKIFNKNEEEHLSGDQQKIAHLRLKHPDFSLLELQMEFNHLYRRDVSKSTISFWLSKIIEYGGKLDDR